MLIIIILKNQMQNLAQAKLLSQKADNFISQGNYTYAASCYDKIIQHLRAALKEATSKDSVEAIKQKMRKFMELKSTALGKQQQKEKPKVKVTTFGFPEQKNSSLDLKAIIAKQPEKKEYPPKKHPENDIRKGLFEKQKKKVQIDPAVQDLIVRNIDVSFKDIVGLKDVKDLLEEAVIRPRERPDLYTGIRAPPRGILLYGPPGNGKTYICKALANQSGCTFFALSASAILNKLVGQSEKMLKKVFWAAEQTAPSIIFIDQIDSMLTSRSQHENDAARRLKTEFLVLMDGINSPKNGEILVIGATNLPRELDSAAKRRFSKMIYLGNPDAQSRREILLRSLKDIEYDLSSSELHKIIDNMQYYSASEIRSILGQVCMIPLRQLEHDKFQKIKKSELRKVSYKDFMSVLRSRKPILAKEDLSKYKL